MYDYIRYPSPLGTLTIAAEGEALTALVIEGQKYAERHLAGAGRERETPVLRAARAWLDRYFSGDAPAAALPLAPKGTEFQRRVWQALRAIPYGRTTTYGALAVQLGSSARAVGGAVGRNPLSILIPCHRVLGADGSLTGYAGGPENKAKLLRLEGIAFREQPRGGR
ncbi:MAG: methylated-DNA--[Oscillospiraceae bacterium]|nr:methylated-DNA--[protein]-cysteine S-methyltransferase [Oscillospiraceae bacterium]